MNKKNRYDKITRRFAQGIAVMPIFWSIGLLTPYTYLLFARLSISLRVKFRSYQFLLLVFFFMIQFLLTLNSAFGELYTSGRFVAALHNNAVYLFFVLGFLISRHVYKDSNVETYLSKIVKLVFVLTIVSAVFLYIRGDGFSYHGVLEKVSVGRTGFFMGHKILRVSILGKYVNVLSIFAVLLYFLYNVTRQSIKFDRDNFSLWLCSILVVSLSGSRICLMVLILVPLVFIASKRSLRIILTVMLPVVVYVALNYGFLEQVLQTRGGSTDTRAAIYVSSIETVMNYNLYFGVGLKPIIDGVSSFPLGSHSTFVGYFFRYGLVGVVIPAFYVLFLVFTTINSAYRKGSRLFITNMLCMFLVLIFFFEDLDAIEMNALLSGVIFGIRGLLGQRRCLSEDTGNSVTIISCVER